MASDAHAFISYVREDRERVDELQRILEAAGVTVWRDTDNLWPGEDWRLKIREAITDGALAFLACFSEHSAARETSYQNEELVLAVDEIRKRPPGRPWLIPVRFASVDIPEYDLGGGRTLGSLQRVDLFSDERERGLSRLVSMVVRLLDSGHTSAVARADATGGTAALVRSALLDESRRIELEDAVTSQADAVATALADEERFPASAEALNSQLEGPRYIVERLDQYQSATQPLVDLFVVGGSWGQQSHESLWKRTAERVANATKHMSGNTALIELQRYPALELMYAVGLAAVHRENFGALRAVAIDAVVRSDRGRLPVVAAAHPWVVFSHAQLPANILAYRVDGRDIDDSFIEALERGSVGKRYTPVSDYLHGRLRSSLRYIIPDDDDYAETFDRLEVILGTLVVDAETHAEGDVYVPGPWFGRFTWRDRYSSRKIEERILQEAKDAGEGWPPVVAGLFGGSAERAVSALETFVALASEARSRHF